MALDHSPYGHLFRIWYICLKNTGSPRTSKVFGKTTLTATTAILKGMEFSSYRESTGWIRLRIAVDSKEFYGR